MLAIGETLSFRRLRIKSAMMPKDKDCQKPKARSQKQI